MPARDAEQGRGVRPDASPRRGRDGLGGEAPTWDAGERLATREACAASLDAILDVVPGLLGGGADLTGNTGTELKGQAQITRDDFTGRQLHFGVREHGMGSIMNGMALSGGALPFGGTFFVFSDYMRPAVRLAALSRRQGRVRLVARLGRPR